MEMWKWNLAFQCVVNLGVRGSETVRRRVVEADLVPVVATILDNYIRAIEKCRQRDSARAGKELDRDQRPTALDTHLAQENRQIHRQQIISPTDVPPRILTHTPTATRVVLGQPTHPPLQRAHSTPVGRAFESRERPLTLTPIPPFRAREFQAQTVSATTSPLASSVEQTTVSSPFGRNINGFGVRAVRDVERLPSMQANASIDMSSQPDSPSTPVPASRAGPAERIRQLTDEAEDSNSWTQESPIGPEIVQHEAEVDSAEDIADLQVDTVMTGTAEDIDIAEGSTTPRPISVAVVDVAGADTYVDPRRANMDDSGTQTAGNTPIQAQHEFLPTAPLPPVNIVNATPPNPRQTLSAYHGRLPASPNLLASLPREEDVVMALQLFAYVTKYCNLRSYFQESHLVARLRVGDELNALSLHCDPSTIKTKTQDELEADWDNEYVCEEGMTPYNIFPLVERFTVKSPGCQTLHTSPQPINRMQYWAAVVMRNLCRKDESRGGTRQCAYWRCGKWEEYPRQFAKCRRCRRTKYCSKDCQKGAWCAHRFWCVPADDATEDGVLDSAARQHAAQHHRSHHHHGNQQRHGRVALGNTQA